MQPFEGAPDAGGSNVVDLTKWLRHSLSGKSGKSKPAAKSSGRRRKKVA